MPIEALLLRYLSGEGASSPSSRRLRRVETLPIVASADGLWSSWREISSDVAMPHERPINGPARRSGGLAEPVPPDPAAKGRQDTSARRELRGDSRQRQPQSYRLSLRFHQLATADQGPEDDDQQRAQRLALRRRLARQVAVVAVQLRLMAPNCRYAASPDRSLSEAKPTLTTARSLAVVHSWRHHRLHLPDCSGPVRGCGCSPQTPHKNRSAPTRHDDRILATIEASDLAVAVDRRAWGKVGLWALRRGR